MTLIIAAALTLYYIWFIGRIWLGIIRIPASSLDVSEPFVSIIVAARNEEAVIERCIHSLLQQSYPRDRMEVIIVDDTSTDATASLVQRMAASDSRIRFVSLPPDPHARLGRKPIAVAAAVAQSRGEITLTTDADCTHGPRWIRTMVGHFAHDVAFVAGPVTLRQEHSLFSRVERLDFLGIVTSVAGLIGAGRPIICNGANLAYRTDVYRRAQDNVQISSNDDGTLMSRIVTRGLGTVTFASDPRAVVQTDGTITLRGFIRQRRRWAAVRGRFLDPSIYVELGALYLFFVTLLVLTGAALFSAEYIVPAGAVWSIKIVMDALALSAALKNWKLEWSLGDFLLAQLVHPLTIVLPPILSALMPFEWKGRILRR